MSTFKFSIPLQKDELLECHAGQYHVEDVLSPRLLLAKFQDAARAYNSEGVDYILDHFDTYFSVLVHGSKLEWNIINKGYDHILRTVKNLSSILEQILQEKDIETDVRNKNLNIVKMTIYLFTQIMKIKDIKLAADNSTKLTLGKKGRKATESDEICCWTESDKTTALLTLHEILQQPLSRLWDPPLAEQDFVSMVVEPCYVVIEDQAIKNKTLRETIFQILGTLIKRYNHGSACIIKLVQVLQMNEHTVSPVCAGVVQLTKDFGLATFAPQMVREIAEALASTEEENAAGTEQGAAKNCGTFLLELTKELPKEMTGAMAIVQPYLESDESYTLRISILGMMCEILATELTGEGLGDEQRIQRDDFLDDLADHMHDQSAYVRHKVLQYWARLQKESCVPVTRQHAVLEKAIGRLRDKAALVRKAAIQLVKVFVECNPFSAQLKLDLLERQLADETEILEGLQRRLNPEPDSEALQEWARIESDVVATIRKKMDLLTQDEAELSQSTLEDLFRAIRASLREGDHYKAYLIVKHVERQHPEAKFLRCSLPKSDQLEYFVALLRNAFVAADRGAGDDELALRKRLDEKESVVAFLQESVRFCRLVAEAVPAVDALLASKQASDALEAIDFFTAAHHFRIDAARVGLSHMLALVWARDQDRREAVERAFRDMYLACDARTERARAFAVASRLAGLLRALDRDGALALQHLLDKWLARGDVAPAVVQVLWETALRKIDGTTDADARAALALLAMVARAAPDVVAANLDVVRTHGLTGDARTRELSARLLGAFAAKGRRLPVDHPIFPALLASLAEAFADCDEFVSFAANAVDFVYGACDAPDLVCSELLAALHDRLGAKAVDAADDCVDVPAEALTRFVFVLGHVALRQLVHLDVAVYGELRRRNQVREERKAEEKKKKRAATPARRGRAPDLRRLTLLDASASSRRGRTPSLVAGGTPDSSVAEEEALEGAVADDADAEYVRGVCERDVVGAGAALGRYAPLLRHALSGAAPPRLQAAAALALTRFMLVSSAACEEGLPLAVTLLRRSPNAAVRNNLTVGFADLTLRFPNLTQPWTPHVYRVLGDGDAEVRRCAVKVLCFLVLHEMVRVKGQIADMALCCADPDPRVADMTRLFFKRLSLKGNALYNVMPDIVSRLGDPELAVDEPRYRLVMKFVMSLIRRDRQTEALVDKLCQRFKLAADERQWRNLAYCLSLFAHNERSLAKLIENLDCYRDKLHCAGVMEAFGALLHDASKAAKAEVKALVAELGEKIEQCFAVRDDDADAAADEPPPEESARPAPRATPRRRAARRRSPDDDSLSDDDDGSRKQEHEVFKKPPARRGLRRRN